MLQRPGNKSRRGFSLTELAIVLGVIGLILGAIWVAAANVSSSNKTQQAISQILAIFSNYRSLYSQHGVDVTDGTDETCTGLNANFFPVEMVPSGATCTASASGTATYTGTALKNPWTGGATVTVNQTNSAIIVMYYGLTRAACNDLAAAVTFSPDVVFEEYSTNNGTSWTSQWLPPITANTAWTRSQFSGFCANSSINAIGVGYKAR